MRIPPATSTAGVPSAPRRRADRRAAALLAAGVLGLVLTGCTSAAEPAAAPSSSAAGQPGGSAPTPSPTPGALTVDITIAGGDVTPNGQKIDVAVGQQVVLDVTSDEPDKIHAHTDGDGFELAVEPGKPATGSFTLSSAGSFEVESHHLEKVIVILNAR